MKTNFLRAALAFGIVTLGASAGTINLVPSTLAPTLGSTFTITLGVTGNTDEILGFGLNYSVTGSSITVQNATINPFFGSDLGLGNPQLSAITFPGSTDPAVTLVTFSLLAASPGMSTFNVTSDLRDPNQGLFTLTGSNADLTKQVTVNVGAAATPEPATMLLVGTALAGLATLRFKRRS